MLKRKRFILLAGSLTGWLASGIYVVGSNEVAVERNFGRASRALDNSVEVKPSGLYWHAPWPIGTSDLVNTNEIRTLIIGGTDGVSADSNGFLRTIDSPTPAQFLSGDKNIIHVTVHIHYRVELENIESWIYGSADTKQRLSKLAEAVVAEVLIRTGVDFLNTLGHDEIRSTVLVTLQRMATTANLGVEITDVTLAGITPPLRVKADFIDVMNARADRETQINQARTYSEQRNSELHATRLTTLNNAALYEAQAKENAAAFSDTINSIEASHHSSDLPEALSKRLHLQHVQVTTRNELLKTCRIVIAPSNPEGSVLLNPRSASE